MTIFEESLDTFQGDEALVRLEDVLAEELECFLLACTNDDASLSNITTMSSSPLLLLMLVLALAFSVLMFLEYDPFVAPLLEPNPEELSALIERSEVADKPPETCASVVAIIVGVPAINVEIFDGVAVGGARSNEEGGTKPKLEFVAEEEAFIRQLS